jgi:multiple sugar transport system substrate-binding protein
MSLAAVVGAASGLAACGAATPQPAQQGTAQPVATSAVAATSAPAATAAAVEIRWADWPDMVGTDDAIKQFQADNSGVTVTFEPFGDNFDQKLMAQCVAGTAPDIMSIYGSMFFAFADKGQLLNLQPLVEANMTDDDRNDFFSWHWPEGFTVPETREIVGLPWKINVGAIIYNKDAFDEVALAYPDETWDHTTYAEALNKLLKKDDSGKVTRWGGLLRPSSWDRFQSHVLAFGGHVVDPKDRTKCMLGEQAAQDGLEWLRKLLWDDKAIMPSTEVEALGGAGALFAQGKCGIYEGMLNAVADQIAPATQAESAALKWDVMHQPKGSAGRFALGSTDGWALYKNSKSPDVAWKFTYFLTQDSYQKANVIDWQNQLAPRRSQFALFETSVVTPWKEKGVDMSMFTKAMEMDYPRPAESFVKQQEAQVILQEMLDKVYVSGDTPVSAFADACAKVDALGSA